MICTFSVFLTDLLCKEHIIDSGDRDTYEYGFQITMANITNALIVLVIGLLFHSILRAALFYAVFISLRMFCGGFHAKTYTRCFCLFGTTCTLCMAASYAMTDVHFLIPMAVLAILLQGVCIWRMAPIENENHPLYGDERTKFRRLSILVYFFWSSVLVFNNLIGYYTAAAIMSATLIAVSILMIKAGKAQEVKTHE